jgi:hypothetical protein
MPLTVPRSALKPIYDWRIERSLYGRETIKYGPVYAYYADLIAFKLQASTPILVEVRGENCGVLFREISKNFTGTGNAGIRIALPSNDAYLVTLSNPSPSPASASGEILVGRMVQEQTSYIYYTYYTEYRTRTEYGPLYPLRFVWLVVALVGVVICIRVLWLQRLDYMLLRGQ